MRQQEVSKAQSEFERELKLNPGCSLAKLGLAGVGLMQGDTEGALKEIETLWRADRGFLQESLPLLREALSEDQREQLLRMAADLEANGNIAAAGSEQVAIPEAPEDAERFYLTGQYQKCSENLRPRLSVLPEPSLIHLTACAFYSGDYRTASLAARRLKSTAATRVSGLYWESNADQKMAITALTHAGETASNSPQLHVLLGDIYRQKEQWEDAENEYRRALTIEAHNQSANLGLAMALFADGKSEEALAIDKALLKEAPDHAEENLLAGEILVRGGRFTEAEPYLNKIRDAGQKFMPRVHTLLGQVYLATDRLPQALSEFKLNQSNDEDGTIHYQLGRIYQRMGDKEKAEEAFRVSQQLRERSDSRVNLTPQ
jgi:predicted Zn-dependent protease